MSWKAISKQKRAHRDEAIAQTLGELGRESLEDVPYLSATGVYTARLRQ